MGNSFFSMCRRTRSLAALMSFSIGLILFRIIATHTVFYGFLIFNLILAAVPFLISGIALENRGIGNRKWPLILASALWLLFFPNAPYILTDFLHFKRESAMPEWFDILMLASFTCSGLAFGFTSLNNMKRLWQAQFSKTASRLMVFASCLLSGLGIYLGRFMRYNSWDLLNRPIELLFDIALLLPQLRTIEFSLGYGLFIFFFYDFICSAQNNRLSSDCHSV